MDDNAPPEIPLSGDPAPPAGPERISAYIKTLPDAPGVYRMMNAKGEVLYVGKAANLKKRVSAYTKIFGHSNRIARMISETAEMIFVSTASEIEALLLESNLIKRLKPRYNVSYRDDKSFPNILLRGDHAFPQVLKHRGARTREGQYFGPFASAGAVNSTLNTLQRAFLLRSCSDAVFDNRTRPCLLYQIKRCSAPCTGRIGERDYASLVAEAKEFLTGKSRAVQESLAATMQQASEALDFERAAQLRDRIRAMSHIQSRQGVNPSSFAEADVFALHREGAHSCVQVFFFRAGQNWGNRPFFPRHTADIATGEVMAAFLGQFYDTRPPPELVLLSEDIPERALIAEALSLRAGHKVEIQVPSRGEKREIVESAQQNARAQLIREQAENASLRELLEGVAATFGLEAAPRRIEVYDNSHIQGTDAVGAMIVAGPEGFQKAEYRRFTIKSEEIAKGDDIGMMREVLTRRFSRLVREASSYGAGDASNSPLPALRADLPRKRGRKTVEQSNDFPPPRAGEVSNRSSGETGGAHASIAIPESTSGGDENGKWNKWPDLVLIDGGEAQVNAAKAALAEVGAEDAVLVGIAKSIERESGREHFFKPGGAPFRLDEKSPILYYLQRLRDEAHRFAIGAHRKRRAKAIGASPLEEIPGVGSNRKRALLTHFGSARAVANASLADLETVSGVSKALARRIFDFFHPD